MWKVDKSKLDDPLDKYIKLMNRLVIAEIEADQAEWMWCKEGINIAKMDKVNIPKRLKALEEEMRGDKLD